MMNGVPRATNPRRLLVFGSFVMVAVVSFALTLVLLSGGGEEPSASKRPSRSGEQYLGAGRFEVSEMWVFDSLDRLVATSDFVVVGTVTENLPGGVEGLEDVPVTPSEPVPDDPDAHARGGLPPIPEEPEDDEIGADTEQGAVWYRDTVVSIDMVLKGPDDSTAAGADSTPTPGVLTVKTLEEEYAPPNREWRKPGERVLLFVWRSEETEKYQPTNHSQSVYVLQDNDVLAAVNDPAMPLIEHVASLSLPELRAEVEEAKVRIASGEVKPLEPPPLDP
jgi:hypothetical protein